LGFPAAAAAFFLLLAPPAALSLRQKTTQTDVSRFGHGIEIPALLVTNLNEALRSYLPSPFLEASALPFMVVDGAGGIGARVLQGDRTEARVVWGEGKGAAACWVCWLCGASRCAVRGRVGVRETGAKGQRWDGGCRSRDAWVQ
jgi:hypothetical protein